MQIIVNEQLKPISREINVLMAKANTQNGKLDRKSQSRLEELSMRRDELATDLTFHTY
jgi:hypothetical protein